MSRLIPLAETTAPERNNFDAIRLAMALLVVWSHSFVLHLGSEDSEWVFRMTNGVVTAGTVGVMVFFIISGFLISQSWDRSKGLRAYFEKRVRRIYPGYMVATAICAFVVLPIYSTDAQIGVMSALKILAHNLLLQNHFPPSNAFATNPYPNAVNGSLWSIPIEFGCYIMIAGLGIAGLAGRGRLLIAATLMALLGRVGLERAGVVPHVGLSGELLVWDQVVPSFLIGMLVYSYRTALLRSGVLLAGLGIAAIAACWISPDAGNLILAPALAYATFYFGFSNRLPLHGAAAYGDFSYGTYLYAFPIQQMLQASIGGGVALPLYIALSLCLSLAAGIASWHLVEKHFMRRGRRSATRAKSRTKPRALLP